MRTKEEKEKHAKYMREYREKYRDEVNATKAEWRRTNRDIYNEQVRKNRLKNLERERQRDRDRYAQNPERKAYRLAHAKESYRKNPGAMRKYVLRKYGLSSEQFEAMLIAQQGRCQICNDPFEGRLDPAIDHCHANDQVRGLLCSTCNTGLGQFKDSPKLLELAAAYLRGGS